MKFLRRDLSDNRRDEHREKYVRCRSSNPNSSVMVTESPPVSPRVVAAILMIQNPSVTAGTLLRPVATLSIGSPSILGRKARSGKFPQPLLFRAEAINRSSLQAAYSLRLPIPVRH